MELDTSTLPEILRTQPVLTRPVTPGELDDQVLSVAGRKPPRAWFIAFAPAMPDRLYQQNHCGIYRLDRPGRRWTRAPCPQTSPQ